MLDRGDLLSSLHHFHRQLGHLQKQFQLASL
jgi:hypothetical protein